MPSVQWFHVYGNVVVQAQIRPLIDDRHTVIQSEEKEKAVAISSGQTIM